jgi:hypothetical protein
VEKDPDREIDFLDVGVPGLNFPAVDVPLGELRIDGLAGRLEVTLPLLRLLEAGGPLLVPSAVIDGRLVDVAVLVSPLPRRLALEDRVSRGAVMLVSKPVFTPAFNADLVVFIGVSPLPLRTIDVAVVDPGDDELLEVTDERVAR